MPDVIYEMAATFFVVAASVFFWMIGRNLENHFSLRRLMLILIGLLLILFALKRF